MIMMMDTKVEEGVQVTTNLPKTTNNLTETPEQTNSNFFSKSLLLVSITVNVLLLIYIAFQQNFIGKIKAAIRGKYLCSGVIWKKKMYKNLRM